MPAPRLLVFDLDGTLVDSLEDITRALNLTLRAFGFPEHPVDRVRGMVGRGVRHLVSEGLGPEGAALVEEALASFRATYQEHLLDTTHLYPGMGPVLETLRQCGCLLAVATNKPSQSASAVLAGLGIAGRFAMVVCGDTLPVRKPDPAMLRHIVTALSVAPAESVMVGDMEVDILAGRAAGMRTAAVTWGYADETAILRASPDHVFTHPAALLSLVTVRPESRNRYRNG